MSLPYPMNKAELERQTGAARLAHEMAEKHYRMVASIKVECESCEFFAGLTRARLCQKWGATPPPEVIPVGCEEWVYDLIPF